MRKALQIFAGFVLAIGTVGGGVSVIALLSDPPSQTAFNATILATSLGIILFAGILWMLADISNALHFDVRAVDSEAAKTAERSEARR
jgi:hypothetical protein